MTREKGNRGVEAKRSRGEAERRRGGVGLMFLTYNYMMLLDERDL